MSACRASSTGDAVTHSVWESSRFLFWVLLLCPGLCHLLYLCSCLLLHLCRWSRLSHLFVSIVGSSYRFLLLLTFVFAGIFDVPSCCLLLFLFDFLVSVSLSLSVSIVVFVLRFRFCRCTQGSGRCMPLCCPGVLLFLCFALFSLSLSLACLCRFFVFVISILAL